MAELPDRMVERPATATRGKGTSIYSIVSAQAGGISDAILRGLAGAKLDEFKPAIEPYLAYYEGLCDTAKGVKTPEAYSKFRTIVKSYLVDDGKFLIDAWKAGLGLQMGTALMGLVETYRGYPHLLSIYQTEKLDASIRPKLERYWLSKYTPNVPDSRTAFRMLMEGVLSRGEFEQYCSYEGWDSSWYDKLYTLYDRDPDEYMAFGMEKRGLIKKAQMKACFRIRGWDAKWDDILYLALHRRPTFRELTTLADYVPLPDLWVREVLRASGYLDGDINYIASAIAMRPLREEVRSVVGRYLWERQIGRIDADTLKANLEKLGLLPKEVELNTLWGELRYQDELLDEKLAILEERCKAGNITTEAEALEAVKALGILEEKANLIAELWAWKYNLA